jgi:hypothetical protein
VQPTIEHALSNRAFYEIVVGKPNTAKAIKDRLNKVQEVIARAAGI